MRRPTSRTCQGPPECPLDAASTSRWPLSTEPALAPRSRGPFLGHPRRQPWCLVSHTNNDDGPLLAVFVDNPAPPSYTGPVGGWRSSPARSHPRSSLAPPSISASPLTTSTASPTPLSPQSSCGPIRRRSSARDGRRALHRDPRLPWGHS